MPFETIGSPLLWVGFLALVLAMLAIDLRGPGGGRGSTSCTSPLSLVAHGEEENTETGSASVPGICTFRSLVPFPV